MIPTFLVPCEVLSFPVNSYVILSTPMPWMTVAAVAVSLFANVDCGSHIDLVSLNLNVAQAPCPWMPTSTCDS